MREGTSIRALVALVANVTRSSAKPKLVMNDKDR